MRKNGGFVGTTHDETIARLYRNLGASEGVAQLQSPMGVLDMYGLVEEGDND